MHLLVSAAGGNRRSRHYSGYSPHGCHCCLVLTGGGDRSPRRDARSFRLWWPSGIFFAALGTFQIAWAPASLPAARRWLMQLALAVNTASILTWALSRTAGLPVGPAAGVPEPIGTTDVVVLVLEFVVCVSVGVCLRRRPPRLPASRGAFAVMGLAAAVIAGLTVPAVSAASSHEHGGPQHEQHHEVAEGGHGGGGHGEDAHRGA